MYIGPYSTTEQQIREDAILSRQIYEEEQKQFEKQIKQIGNKSQWVPFRFNKKAINS